MKSSSAAAAASLLAVGGSLCPGSARVRLRPDATYVQLGDVDVPGARCVRIVHISDTLQARRKEDLSQLIPDGDVLVHSGGLEGGGGGGGVPGVDGIADGGGNNSNGGSGAGNLLTQPLEPLLEQRHLRRLRDFLAALPHRHKVLVPSSRDSRLHRFASGRSAQELQRKLGPCHYLHDSAVTLEGVTFYGVPGHSPRTGREKSRDTAAVDCNAGSCGGGDGSSDNSWRKVPDEVDVLVAHNPPWDQLAQEVFQRVRPKALLHGQFGTSENGTHWRDGVLVSNGSLAKVTKPVVIDFYTSRPGGNSLEYSEVMMRQIATTASGTSGRLKKAPNSACAVM